jgi:hypothetical protein
MVNSGCGCKEKTNSCSTCCPPSSPVLNCTILSGTTLSTICGLNSAGQLVLNFYPIQSTCANDPNAIVKYVLYVSPGANTVSTTNFTMIYNISPNVSSFVTGVIGSACFSAILVAVNACGQSSLPSTVFNSPGCIN